MSVKEIWKDVPGYEEIYQVSNMGKVRSKDRLDNLGKKIKGRELRPFLTNGYPQVSLHRNGKRKKTYVHRLVAEVFIENESGLPVVNHKNEIKTDSRAENLEWCSDKYNKGYGTIPVRASARMKGRTVSLNTRKKLSESHKKQIIRERVSDGEIKHYSSIGEAEKDGFTRSRIGDCLNGRVKQYRGYFWRTAEAKEE